jgi:hypothetical protein
VTKHLPNARITFNKFGSLAEFMGTLAYS